MSGQAQVSPVPRRPFYWSVRRELWENRSIVVAPLAAAAVFLAGFMVSLIRLPAHIAALSALDPAHQQQVIEKPYDFVAVLVLLTACIVAVFYSLDALHGERRDRSILFWKSLPVSDLTTVLSKACVPLAVLPLFIFALIVTVQLFMLLLSSAVLLAHGMSPTILWTHLPVFGRALCLLYGLAVMALWHAPVYGWLLLVSAWAKRSTFLWALLPPLALCLVERIALDSNHLFALLVQRLIGWFHLAFDGSENGSTDPLAALTPLQYLGSPALWIGLVFAAIFLAAAVQLRHRREPI